MTKRTRWLEEAQRCYIPKYCRWPRKAKWSCGCVIPSIRKRAARGLGRRATSRTRLGRTVRHEPATPEWPREASSAGKQAVQKHGEKVARRSSRRNGPGWATTGESARRTPMVRTEGGCRFGTIVGKDLLRGGSLAPRDTHSRSSVRPDGEGGRTDTRLRFRLFRVGFFGRRAGGRRFCARGLPGR